MSHIQTRARISVTIRTVEVGRQKVNGCIRVYPRGRTIRYYTN